MQIQVHGGDIYSKAYRLDFSTNINPFGMPESLKQAAIKGIDASIHYPDVQCRELINAIAKKEEIPSDWIICGNGAAELLFSLVSAKKPQKALLVSPGFAEYEQAARAMDAQMVYYYLKEEMEFRLDETFLEMLTNDVDMVFLCNPNNPTGHLIEKELLLSILKRCVEQDIFLVVDECFNDFLNQPQAYSLLNELEHYENLLILKAFTKTYAMAGLRLGYGLCSNQAFLQKMADCSQPWAVSIPAQFAGVAALKETAYVQESMELLKTERAFLKAELKQLGFQVFDSQANYIFFKAMPGLKQACAERGILIRDCSNYVGLVPGYFRIGVKRHEENQKLVSVLKEIVNRKNCNSSAFCKQA